MLIDTGKENSKGEFHTRVIGESREGETARDAIKRVAERFLGRPLDTVKHRWHETWGVLGKEDNPTRLPALFVKTRLFSVSTRWDAEKLEHILA